MMFLTKLIVLLTTTTCCVVSFSDRSVLPKRTFQPLTRKLVVVQSSSSSDEHQQSRAVIALTREEGKNDKLRTKLLSNDGLKNKIDVIEVPCIAHADGPDFDKLSDTLQSQKWDYVTVTSPEAARVLASAWSNVFAQEEADKPCVVAVGKATEETLEQLGIKVSFCPTKATAKTLAAELPLVEDATTTTVLYPASAKAKVTLEQGLQKRGFKVTRLNTYDTVTATWSDAEQDLASKASVVCFASPSSIKGWLKNTNDNNQIPAACIGETSAQACQDDHEWKQEQIFYPEKPGMDGWVQAVADAVDAISHETSSSAATATTTAAI